MLEKFSAGQKVIGAIQTGQKFKNQALRSLSKLVPSRLALRKINTVIAKLDDDLIDGRKPTEILDETFNRLDSTGAVLNW